MDQFVYQNYQPTNTAYKHNKVYINRNFNRVGPDGVPSLSTSNVMYFNPNFSQTVSLQHNIVPQKDQTMRPRIHVNPNFIRSKPEDSLSVNCQMNTGLSISRPTSTCFQLSYTQQTKELIEHHKKPVSNSRYCLVRQKENKVIQTPLVKTLPNNTQQTIKVNKYKTISINTVKKNLATDKSSSSKICETAINQSNFMKSKSKYRTSSKPILNKVQNTRFKYTKRNSIATPDIKHEIVKKPSITLNRTVHKTNCRQTKKINKGAMKKNNIPCPLFKKYGKCLRMIRGYCDYLHDKKHVSICRKFLKGICHDKQCLLSHDLTDKKMPTCYFYLQGNCTKEGCPYLHVKLNEKTKVCLDFLKGYCEKGDKCLHRHVNISSAATNITKALKKSYPLNDNKIMNIGGTKVICRKNKVSNTNNTTPVIVVDIPSIQETTKDQRYFRDLADNPTSEDQYDLIKPTRCKLGALPSFIQL